MALKAQSNQGKSPPVQRSPVCAAPPGTSVTAYDDTPPPQPKRPRRRAYGDQVGPEREVHVASVQQEEADGARGNVRNDSQASSQKVCKT